MVLSCAKGNKPSGSIKDVEFLDYLEQCFSNCSPRLSVGGFGSKSTAKIVSDIERIKKYIHAHLC
jgi:hypothetical protein